MKKQEFRNLTINKLNQLLAKPSKYKTQRDGYWRIAVDLKCDLDNIYRKISKIYKATPRGREKKRLAHLQDKCLCQQSRFAEEHPGIRL